MLGVRMLTSRPAMKCGRLLVLALGLCLGVGSARADETAPAPPQRLWGPVAGSLTALVPLMVGSVFVAQDDRRDLQRDGIYIMTAGFAAAPWVAHGVDRRWKRAAVFGLVSLATSAATLAMMEARDPFDPDLVNRRRLPFGLLLTSAFSAATVGVIDSFIVRAPTDERWP
ncbi:MAG: hypothetical protein QOI66_5364 [Myxococcales bacterium]|nr:hypothetical protein [Myxococcales bacterium]